MAAKKGNEKAGGKAWFQKGEQGAKRAAQVDAEAQARRKEGGPRRFWLDSDQSGKVTFLDTPQFFLHEHNLKLSGKFFNFFTCIKDVDVCPICESGDNPSYVLVGTVINHREYKDKDGNVHTNQKQLFVAKGRARQRLMKQIERREGNLRGAVFEMARGSSPTECSTGEDFEFIGRLTDEKMKLLIPDGEKADWLEPFSYEELLKPKTVEELRAIVGQAPPVGAEKSNQAEDEEGPEPKEEKKSGKEGVKSIDDLL